MQGPDKRLLIIHAGFHRTGTSTVQSVLKAQHSRLAHHVSVILKPDIAALCQAALAYAERPDTSTLGAFQTAAQSHFKTDPEDQRPILMSAEDLCGMFPGRKGRIGYPHAKALLSTLVSVVGPAFAPHIYLSTRQSMPWLKSCYAHNLRHARVRLSFEDFMVAHDGPSLQDIAEDIRSELEGTPVTTCCLKDSSAMPEGPLSPILDLLDMPAALRGYLRPPAIVNASFPPDIQAAFLLLNRDEDDGAVRRAAKKQLIANLRSGDR